MSNYLLLTGGTLTGQLIADNLGVEFGESDTNPTCAAGNYNIFADLSEVTLKKCINGVASDLDTGGGAPTTADYWTASAQAGLSAEVVVNSESTLETAIGGANLLIATEIDDSSKLAAIVTDETGSGVLAFATAPTFTDLTVNDLITFTETAGDASCGAGDYWQKGNSSTGKLRGCENGSLFNLNTTAGACAWDSLTAPTGAVLMTSDGTSETITFSFEAAFTTGCQFCVASSVGNPTNGTLFRVQGHDANPHLMEVWDGTNGIRVTAAGALAAVGSGSITATAVAANSVALTTDTTGNYAAGDGEAGAALTGDTATAFFSAGAIEAARGGTAADSSGSTGVPRVGAGAWTFDGAIGHLATSTSADLFGVLSDETGTGVAVFGTSPTFTTSFSQSGDAADTGFGRFQNNAQLCWEAAPAGTDVCVEFDASEIFQVDGTLNAGALTEGGTAVPNVGDNLSVFAATTVAQLATLLSDDLFALDDAELAALAGVTNSSTVGQIMRVTGASTYAWGAVDLADADAVTGVLPLANQAEPTLGTNTAGNYAGSSSEGGAATTAAALSANPASTTGNYCADRAADGSCATQEDLDDLGGTVATGQIEAAAVTTALVEAELKTQVQSFTIDPTVAATGEAQFRWATAVTITDIRCDTDAGTVAGLNFEERAPTTPNSAGTDVLASDITADTNQEVGSCSPCTNAGIDAYDPVALTYGTVTTATILRCYVTFTID